MCPGLQVARSALNLTHVKKCPGKSKREILDYNIKFTACVWVIIFIKLILIKVTFLGINTF